MKREYAEDKQHNSNSNSKTMFPKFHHQTHKFQQPPPPQNHLHHPFPSPPTITTSECPTSEEADSHSTSHSSKKHSKDPRPPPPPLLLPPPPALHNDGATIEVVRRQRGRPPGSKNKPKPPVIITRDSSEPSMSPYVLELPPGVEVIEATTRFCRKRNIGLCILNGNGVVSNVTLKQPSSTTGATVTFHGRFDILSISATILPVAPPDVLSSGLANGFTISLAGPQGQMVGGLVVGPLVSAATIYLIATTFNSPSYHRLQPYDNDVNRDQSPQAASGGGGGGGDSGGGGAGECGISIYSYQTSDVIWAPSGRQQQPPPSPPY